MLSSRNINRVLRVCLLGVMLSATCYAGDYDPRLQLLPPEAVPAKSSSNKSAHADLATAILDDKHPVVCVVSEATKPPTITRQTVQAAIAIYQKASLPLAGKAVEYAAFDEADFYKSPRYAVPQGRAPPRIV